MRRKFYVVLRGNTKSVSIVPSNTAVVPLRSQGAAPIFFMIDSYPHFIDLVQLISANHPVLSLVGQEETQTGRAGYSIRDEAAAHRQTILERQPSGPYFIGGCSASGIVAYETAVQLQSFGHQIGLLVLFDTPNPYFMGEYSAWRRSLAANRTQLSLLRWADTPGWFGRKVLDWAVRSTKWLRAALGTMPTASRDQLMGPLESRILAAQHYCPQPFSGPLLIVKRRRERLHGRYRDAYYGWRGMVEGKPAVCEVSAEDHLEIFKDEADRARVAELLSAYLSDAAPAMASSVICETGLAESSR